MTYSGGAREVSCRVDVMRNGVRATTLTPLEPPVVIMDSTAEIKMRMNGRFLLNQEADLLNDTLKPWLILDGKEYPVGEYVAGTIEEEYNGVNGIQRIEAFDLSLLLQQWTKEEWHYIPAGTTYVEAVQSLFQDAGFKRILFDPVKTTIKTNREDWEPGTPFLTIINTLLEEINYNPVWIDPDGIARVTRQIEPTQADIIHIYEEGPGSLLLPRYTRTLDIYDAPNVFNVVLANPDYAETMSATSVNDSIASAISVPRRGRRIVAPTVELENAASWGDIQRKADRLRFESMLSEEQVVFETAAVPGHMVGDVISLSIGPLNGIFTEIGWEMTLGPGVPMRHTARRSVFVR